MIFKQSNRTDADQVFIGCRNVSGATVSAGVPVEWDISVATDGNAVTQCKSGTGSLAGLFAGITDASLADSAYGLVQVYGFRTSAYCSFNSADGGTPGQFLKPIAGQLEPQTMSAATTSGHIFVTLMDTVAGAAGASTVQYQEVFIRAL